MEKPTPERLNKDETLMHEWKNVTELEKNVFNHCADYFENGLGSTASKLENFPKYVRRQSLSKFLSRVDIFRKILDVHGSVIDGGINAGCSLMTFAQISAIFEPVNYTRRIIGFDIFTGIPELHEKDISSGKSSPHVRKGGFNAEGYDKDLLQAIEIFDSNRNLGHIPKVEIVKGDVKETMPEYVRKNPHLVVSLLHLDMDVYEATKVAIETFVPRMSNGAIIIFDELNQPGYPGETLAVLETLGIRNIRIQRCTYETGISYAVLE
ncbi:hypothetical protein ES707_15804 [subsurface metagenome]